MRTIGSVLTLSLALVAQRVDAQADPYAGTFTNGVLTLQLQGGNGAYQGTALIQGQQFPVTARLGMNGLEGTYTAQGTAYPWTAALQGDVLIMYVDGQTLQLQRQPAGYQPSEPRGGNAQPGSAGPAPTGQQQLSPAGQEWYTYLVGKRLTRMDSYSSYDASGAGGGYSAREQWDLCRNGRFFYSGSSMVSAGSGGGGVSGYNGGNEGGAGQWLIIEEGALVGIELRWNDGNLVQARLEYSEGGTYANGERIYVTADNTSCR